MFVFSWVFVVVFDWFMVMVIGGDYFILSVVVIVFCCRYFDGVEEGLVKCYREGSVDEGNLRVVG